MVKGMVSIIIPTYNRGKYIFDSVMSVLNQSYSNIEVIVVDDGSTDDTNKILKEIKDNRFIYIKLKKNGGACKARNVGIKKAKGEYIAFQDSDDIFLNNKLEKQLNNLLMNNSDLDFCKIRVNVNNINEIPNYEQDKILSQENILENLCHGNFISTQAILAKRHIFSNILFDEKLPRLQDYDLVLRIAQKYKISYTKEVLVDLYRHGDNISNSPERLKKACYIMLNKNYRINENDKFNLYETLLNYNISPIMETLNTEKDKCVKLNNKKEEYAKQNNEIKEKYNKLLCDYNELLNSYNNNYNQLQLIINSKGWKLLEKIRKLKRK